MVLNYLLLAGVAVFSTGAHAQGVYRCGNTFSERPCGPDAKVLVAPPAPSRKFELPADVPPPADRIAANIATCEKKTRAALKDPDSAKIKDISRAGPALQRYQGATLVGVSYHMNVNAKNSYGGYTGEKLYSCVFAMDETTYLYSQEIAAWPN